MDTREWMASVGFKAETIDRLLKDEEFTAVAPELSKGYLRQQDYSKQMNDLKKTQDDLAAANGKLTADMQEWASLTAAEKGEATKLREDLDKSREEVFRLQTKVTRLAEDHGVDPKTILGDVEVKPPEKKEPVVQPFDPTGIQQQIGGVAEYMLTLNAELPAIADEHLALTGEKLDTRAFIAGIKEDLKNKKFDNLDPVKRWEGQFEIPKKRDAKATADRDQWGKDRFEEGRRAAMSEAALPTQPHQGQHAVVFRTQPKEGSKLQRPQPGNRLGGAVAALASRKYLPGSGQKTA